MTIVAEMMGDIAIIAQAAARGKTPDHALRHACGRKAAMRSSPTRSSSPALRRRSDGARAILEPQIPGTAAHARRQVENRQIAGRIRDERDRAQAY
jgi:hypothetical protein